MYDPSKPPPPYGLVTDSTPSARLRSTSRTTATWSISSRAAGMAVCSIAPPSTVLRSWRSPTKLKRRCANERAPSLARQRAQLLLPRAPGGNLPLRARSLQPVGFSPLVARGQLPRADMAPPNDQHLQPRHPPMGTTIVKRNPIAKDLRTPKYAPRIVKSKRIYTRKGRNK